MLQQNFRNDAHRADSLLAGRARANAGARHGGRPTAVARALGTVSSYVLRREDGQSKQVAKLARLARHGGVRCGYGLMEVKNGYSSISSRGSSTQDVPLWPPLRCSRTSCPHMYPQQ